MKKTMMVMAVFALLCAGIVTNGDTTTTLKITNNTDQVIQHLYVSPQKLLVYGTDRIEDELLQPGDSLEITVKNCDQMMDLRAVPTYKGQAIERKVKVTQCGGTLSVALRAS